MVELANHSAGQQILSELEEISKAQISHLNIDLVLRKNAFEI